MAVKLKSIAGKVSALALAVSALALPLNAQAQEEGRRFRDSEAAGNISGDYQARPAPRSAPREDQGRGWARPAQAAPQAALVGDFQQSRAAQAPGWNRSADRRAENGGNGNPRGWDNRGGGNGHGNAARPATLPQPEAAPAPAVRARGWTDRQTDRSQDWSRGDARRSYYEAYRRVENRRDAARQWDNRGDRARYAAQQDHRRWDNRWRDNRRYDWYSYRRTYPSTFRVGIYYSPFRNYSYRRLNIGFFLDSLFYSNRYWINDPWQYRLPDVYGPYRWVRYYDDALLVNTYSGEVVDVIYSFFW